jgi:hypothetical protein
MERKHAHRCPSAGWPAVVVLAVAVVFLVMAPAAAAGPRSIIFDWLATPSWTATLTGGGTLAEEGTDVIALPGDSCLVAGTLVGPSGTTDISLTKYRGSTKLWTKTWPGSSGNDNAGKAALSPDGKAVYITGWMMVGVADADLVLLKRSVKNGRLLWAKTYGHSNPELPTAIAVDPAGEVTVCAWVMNPGNYNALVVRWTPSGARKWAWSYDNPSHQHDVLLDVLPGPKGSVYVLGETVLAGPHEASLVARLSATGNKLWLKTYQGPADAGALVIAGTPRPGGGIYAAGATRMGTSSSGLILQYNPSGRRTVFAVDTGPAPTSRSYADIAVASDKTVVAVGRSDATGVNQDAYVATWKPDGTAIGRIALPGAWYDEFDRVAVDAFGGFYAVGTYHAAAADQKILTVRGSVFSGGGGFASVWGPTVSEDNGPSAVAVRDTTAYVAGQYQSGAPTGIDQVLLTYRY